MRSRDGDSNEVRVAQLRVPGLLRMIASAENRGLKLSAEGKEQQAAFVQTVLRRYRLELARLTALIEGREPTAATQPEDISEAVDEALRQLREERERQEHQEAAKACTDDEIDDEPRRLGHVPNLSDGGDARPTTEPEGAEFLDPAAANGRCADCGTALPTDARATMRYCEKTCRDRAYKSRKRRQQPNSFASDDVALPPPRQEAALWDRRPGRPLSAARQEEAAHA